MEVQIVTPKAPYAPIRLIEPTTRGYIHVAAEVQPRALPLLPNRREKAALLTRLKIDARQIVALDTVKRATIFDSVGYSPLSPYLTEWQVSFMSRVSMWWSSLKRYRLRPHPMYRPHLRIRH